MTTHQLDALPSLMTVAEVQQFLRIGRTKAYEIARQHGIRISPRAIRIPLSAIREILQQD